jgi:hypothetical protein
MRACTHLALNTRQPFAAILDERGAERHFCAACTAERVAALLMTKPPKKVAQALQFNRCKHHETVVCYPCYLGVTGYLSMVWAMLAFTDKPLAHRFSKMLRRLSQLHDVKPLAAIPTPNLGVK